MSCPTSRVTPGPYLMLEASIANAVSHRMGPTSSNEFREDGARPTRASLGQDSPHEGDLAYHTHEPDLIPRSRELCNHRPRFVHFSFQWTVGGRLQAPRCPTP